jgi:hypothetical protein
MRPRASIILPIEYPLGFDYDRGSDEHVLYVSKMPDLAVEFQQSALIIGDAVHNLRSSLDYLVCQLSIVHTKNDVRDIGAIQFPICDTEEAWKVQEARRLQEISPNDRAKIQEFQPYTVGYMDTSWNPPFHPLAMLRDLSNLDKHQRIIKMALSPAQIHHFYIDVFEVLFHFQAKRWGQGVAGIDPIELNTEIARGPSQPSLPKRKWDLIGYISPQVFFSEGRAVLPVMEKVVAFVIKLVGEFQLSF